MSYIKIDDLNVYISAKAHKILIGEILKDETPEVRIASIIANTKESQRFWSRLIDYLRAERSKDHKQFYEKRVKFRFTGEDAKDNLWDLFYDYCYLTGNGFLTDNRDFTERFTADYEGEALRYPMGKVFDLEFPIKNNYESGILGVLKKRSPSSFEVRINVECVKLIEGTLDSFYAVFQSSVINFNTKQGINLSA